MRVHRIRFGIGIAALYSLGVAQGLNAQIDSKIVSVGLFKNGLATIEREVQLEGPGSFLIKNIPEPVHGTFYIESQDPIQASIVAVREKLAKTTSLGRDLQRELGGLKVTIRTRSSETPVTGVVIASPKPNEPKPPVLLPGTGWTPFSSASHSPASTPVPPSRFLILKKDQGISYVDINEIVALDVSGEPTSEDAFEETVSPRLSLRVGPNGKGGIARIHYLAHGISWAPNYRVHLLDDKNLTVEQQAIVRNELEDFQQAEVAVISGYPNIQFANVISPFSPTQNWAAFFQQLNGQRYNNVALSNSVMTQSLAYSMGGGNAATGPSVAPNLGDTLDLHYQSIGKQDLGKGSVLAVSMGKAKTSYQRIVEWNIPDTRDEWGHPGNARQVDPTTGQALQDDVWDTLKFKNVLPFPMTSAAATVTTGDRFSGQGQIHWTNRNEETSLRVNKALSIRASHVEFENSVGESGQSDREVVYVSGRRCQKVKVNGELKLCNHRDVEIQMNIQRQFSGDYVSGDGKPKIDLREEGAWSLNKRNRIVWALGLKPNEEKTIKYQYTLVIPF